MKSISTLGLYMAFDNTIENVGVKVRVLSDTDLTYSVFLSDEQDDEGKCLKIFSSTISMHKTKDYTDVSLPVNIYLNNQNFHIELAKNPELEYDKETLENLVHQA